MGYLFVFLAILAALAILMRLDFIFYIVYVVAGLWLVARIGYRRGLQSLTWRRTYPHHAFLGDILHIQVSVHNRSFLPLPWLRIVDTVPVNLFGKEQARQVISLERNEGFQFVYSIECRRRGYYQIGPLTITGGDPLGFVEFIHEPLSTSSLIVYPQIISLANLELDSRQPFGELRTRQRLFDDPSRLAGIRDYHMGDSLRSIHWKASAHIQKLQVKKTDPAEALESFILLNLNRSDFDSRNWRDGSEWSIVLTASITYRLAQYGQSVGLGILGSDQVSKQRLRSLPPHSGRSHLMQILETLARATTIQSESFEMTLDRLTVSLNWGTTLIVISPQGTQLLLSALHQLARRGFQIVLIITEAYASFDKFRSEAQTMGIKAVNLYNENSLKKWLLSS